MTDAITALTTGVTGAILWDTVENIVPVLIVVVPFALGLYFLRKVVKGVSKGKARF